jgi:hypothetical protein
MTTDQTTHCAICYSLQPCIDDGEAYICADRAACRARVSLDAFHAARAALFAAQERARVCYDDAEYTTAVVAYRTAVAS